MTNSFDNDRNRPAGAVTVLSIEGIPLRLVWCPAGSFEMGSADRIPGAPRHHVQLSSGYWISQFQVSQELWSEVMGQRYRSAESDPLDNPVDGVTWDSAVSFCRALSQKLAEAHPTQRETFFSLPTEAQWEYACRAGTTSRWHFGEDVSLLANHAWFADNSENHVHPVGRKLPNPWGMHDFYGNVAEWCLDDYDDHGLSSPRDPLAVVDGQLKIVRGGSYVDDADQCDSASRRPLMRDNPFTEESGIRLVLNLTRSWIENHPFRDLVLPHEGLFK